MISMLNRCDWTPDLVVPVPMDQQHRDQRGYNQAALLALPLALATGVPYQAHALAKSRQTRSQVGLSLAERRANVESAFRADPRLVGSKSVLIVDDVTTTGATLEACTLALLEAGAWQVWAITLARAVGNNAPYPSIPNSGGAI